MKRLVLIVSAASLALGLLIATYSWQAQNIADNNARQQAEAALPPGTYGATWITPTIPIEERALGMAFGFGLSFLGAFGLYASLRIPQSPAVKQSD